MPAPLALADAQVVGTELAIRWQDGRESYLPLEVLRRSCPCALCQGESTATASFAPRRKDYTPESFVVRALQPVGGYALQLVWADGHGTGIYPYAYLISLGEEPPPAG